MTRGEMEKAQVQWDFTLRRCPQVRAAIRWHSLVCAGLQHSALRLFQQNAMLSTVSWPPGSSCAALCTCICRSFGHMFVGGVDHPSLLSRLDQLQARLTRVILVPLWYATSLVGVRRTQHCVRTAAIEKDVHHHSLSSSLRHCLVHHHLTVALLSFMLHSV